MLNKASGLKGLTGVNDLREVHRLIGAGYEKAELGLAVYTRRLTKYIASYLAILEGADAIVFTGGVGENDPVVRAMSIAPLATFGVAIDETKNASTRGVKEPVDIGAADSRVRVLVIPTNEEQEIANQVFALVG